MCLNSFKKLPIILCFVLAFVSNQSEAASKKSLERRIIKLLRGGSVVLNDENGKKLFTYQENKSLIPASLLKILSSLAAIKELGEDFRFKTEFYQDTDRNIAVKGWGDPVLISEEIILIADKLKEQNSNVFKRLYLDRSAFSNTLRVRGVSDSLNPYDAINGALIVNFNTLNIIRDHNGVVSSAEFFTPLTKLAVKRGKVLKPGSKRRVNFGGDPAESLRYTGELFAKIFEREGVLIKDDRISPIIIDESWHLIYTHHNSQPLLFTLKELLKYSNNFIANQIFLIMGAQKKGWPACLEKSRSVFQSFIDREFVFKPEELTIDEASGISRKNRMTAGAMARILEKFRPYAKLLEFKNVTSGTNLTRVKSGTLKGVYNYAGYFETNTGLRPFVIIMNQKRNNRDMVLKLLRRHSDLSPSQRQTVLSPTTNAP